MSAMHNSTLFRGILGFVQVMGIAVVAAAAQQRSQPIPDGIDEAICASEKAGLPDEASGSAIVSRLGPISQIVKGENRSDGAIWLFLRHAKQARNACADKDVRGVSSHAQRLA